MDNFKPTYTKEEIDELVAWIDATQPTGSIDLGEGMYISDIKLFCSRMRTIALTRYNNSAYGGQICVLVNLRKEWDKQHGATSSD
ncbi:MAG: hypothetical protein J1F25_05550 [Prevotellaceae bacterium]|nr:hypothetical protein [Prevotellaceae bacterium]